MPTESQSELQFQLRKLMTKHGDAFQYHQWVSEHARWVELVFALISMSVGRREAEVREAVETLDALGLLDIEDLSQIAQPAAGADLSSPHAKRIAETLVESGFEREQAEASLATMIQVATSLRDHYHGKVQHCLRIYGQRILDELSAKLALHNLPDAVVRQGLIYWLQNVLNMPIFLVDADVEQFCKGKGITVEGLLEAADGMDLNVALLDDLIAMDVQAEEGPERARASAA